MLPRDAKMSDDQADRNLYQPVTRGHLTAQVTSQIQERAFDYLDAPVLRVGALDGISPQAYVLEQAYLPNVNDVVAAARGLMGR